MSPFSKYPIVYHGGEIVVRRVSGHEIIVEASGQDTGTNPAGFVSVAGCRTLKGVERRIMAAKKRADVVKVVG